MTSAWVRDYDLIRFSHTHTHTFLFGLVIFFTVSFFLALFLSSSHTPFPSSSLSALKPFSHLSITYPLIHLTSNSGSVTMTVDPQGEASETSLALIGPTGQCGTVRFELKVGVNACVDVHECVV